MLPTSPECACLARSFTNIATRTIYLTLALEEDELELLEAALSQGRSRRLARQTGHGRETVCRWQAALRTKIGIALRRSQGQSDAA